MNQNELEELKTFCLHFTHCASTACGHGVKGFNHALIMTVEMKMPLKNSLAGASKLVTCFFFIWFHSGKGGGFSHNDFIFYC